MEPIVEDSSRVQAKSTNIVASIFRILLTLIVLSILVLLLGYAEYWYFRTQNPDMNVSEPIGKWLDVVDRQLNIEWKYLEASPKIEEEAMLSDLGSAPEIEGVTQWYKRDPNSISRTQYMQPEHTSEPQSLAMYRGKSAVVLVFGRYYCSYCLNIYSFLDDYRQTYGDQIAIIALQSPKYEEEKDWNLITKTLDEREVMFPVGLDIDKITSDKYNIEFLPTLLLINKEGRIMYKKTGLGNMKVVYRAIDELLDSK